MSFLGLLSSRLGKTRLTQIDSSRGIFKWLPKRDFLGAQPIFTASGNVIGTNEERMFPCVLLQQN
jgi:hypothetical protein